MWQLILQLKFLTISIFGIIVFLPGPDKKGELRIKGTWGHVITYSGIAILFIPWFIIPFLAQPRFIGSLRGVMIVIGVILALGAIILYLWSLKVIIAAFGKPFSEFNPSSLITTGPFRLVRNPIYLAAFIIFVSLYMVMGATLSIFFLPILYLIFRLITLYEEKKILQPKFSTVYTSYREEVKGAILGFWGGIIIGIPGLVLIVISLMNLTGVASFGFIK